MIWFALRRYHAISTAATVPIGITEDLKKSPPRRRGPDFSFRSMGSRLRGNDDYLAGTTTSVRPVRELLELRILVDHAQVLVGDEALGGGRLGEGAVRLHELANAGQPLVDIGRAARAAHDLELAGEIEHWPG